MREGDNELEHWIIGHPGYLMLRTAQSTSFLFPAAQVLPNDISHRVLIALGPTHAVFEHTNFFLGTASAPDSAQM